MITNRIRVFYNIFGLGENFSIKLVLNKLLVDLRQKSCDEILFSFMDFTRSINLDQ
jgi:hypothetical protein